MVLLKSEPNLKIKANKKMIKKFKDFILESMDIDTLRDSLDGYVRYETDKDLKPAYAYFTKTETGKKYPNADGDVSKMREMMLDAIDKADEIVLNDLKQNWDELGTISESKEDEMQNYYLQLKSDGKTHQEAVALVAKKFGLSQQDAFDCIVDVVENEQTNEAVSINLEELKDVKELFYNLIDGIDDIKDYYPKQLVDFLSDEDFIEEDKNFSWVFTAVGKAKFKNEKDLQKYLIDNYDGETVSDKRGPSYSQEREIEAHIYGDPGEEQAAFNREAYESKKPLNEKTKKSILNDWKDEMCNHPTDDMLTHKISFTDGHSYDLQPYDDMATEVQIETTKTSYSQQKSLNNFFKEKGIKLTNGSRHSQGDYDLYTFKIV